MQQTGKWQTGNRFYLIVIALILLSGCSTRYLYNHLDTLAIKYIDDAVNLNASQKTQLKTRLDYLLRWHRQEALPQYLKVLKRLRNVTPGQVNAEFVQAQRREISGFVADIAQRAAPDIADFVQQLTPAQRQILLSDMRERYADIDKNTPHMDEAQARKQYQKRLRGNVRRWLGSISAEQENILQHWSQHIEFTGKEWQQQRWLIYQNIEALLRLTPAPADLRQQIIQMVQTVQRNYSMALKNKLRHNQQLADEAIVALAASMNQNQWQYYRKQIDHWYKLTADIYQTSR